MSVILKFNSQDDYTGRSIYLVNSFNDKGIKSIRITCLESTTLEQYFDLKFNDEFYTYIDCFSDGVYVYLATNSNFVRCYNSSGNLFWEIEISEAQSFFVENIISKICNYSDEHLMCVLDENIGKLFLISKATGRIDYIFELDYYNIHIFNIEKERYLSTGEWVLKIDNFQKINRIKKYIKFDECVSFFESDHIGDYFSSSTTIYFVQNNKIIKKHVLKEEFIMDMIITPLAVLILKTTATDNIYELLSFDRNVSKFCKNMTIRSDSKPLFLRNRNTVVATEYYTDHISDFEVKFHLHHWVT
jgi:hypothetical protein